jgi:hypothetical protein
MIEAKADLSLYLNGREKYRNELSSRERMKTN